MSKVTEYTGIRKLPRFMYMIFIKFPWLIPCRIKWKSAAKGVGLLVSALGDTKENDPANALKKLGLKQGSAIAKELGIGKNVKEVMQVTVMANSIYGTKSVIENISEKSGRTLVKKCAWAGKDWGARPCALLSAYEVGLVEGLNPSVKTKYLKKISRGDDHCLTEYFLEEGKI